MIVTVIGGSASGKSNIAEDIMCSLSNEERKYYVATMKVGDDEENIERVAKHREARKEKNFVTIECPSNVENAVKEMDTKKNVLLECVSNLTANEMFFGNEISSAEDTACKVIKGIKALAEEADNLVIVSNNIFESGSEYDESTRSYLKALGDINRELVNISDEVYEAVVGIKVKVK